MHTVFIPYKSIFLSESVFSPILCGPMECGLPLEFFSQEFWSGLSFPTPGYLPNPEIESESLESPALTTDSLLLVPPEKSSMFLSSVQSLSRVRLFATHELQHARPPCPSPTPRVHPNSCPSSWWCHPASNPSQHQSLFQWVNTLHDVAKVLEFQLQHQSFQWTPRTGLL